MATSEELRLRELERLCEQAERLRRDAEKLCKQITARIEKSRAITQPSPRPERRKHRRA